jgi:hypothetical protein
MSISHRASLLELLREALVNSYACFPLGYIFAVLFIVQLVRRKAQHFKYVGRTVQKWYEEWQELISTEYFSQKILFLSLKAFRKKTNGLKNSVQLQTKHTVSPLVPFIDHWLLHLPPDLTFKNCVLPTHCIYVFCKALRKKQKPFFPLYSSHWLVFITETEGVYCALRTGC